jgi:ABC-type polysaccharide/polyol phosphate transport system ATPase subunit/8-oxo-dGTP pyrophosphatase MutT (NUDIX family)
LGDLPSAVRANAQAHSVLAVKTMNIKPSVNARGAVPLSSRQARISARELALDFPIYDVTSRSLKQLLMVRPIANALRGASHVGGSIAAGAGGTMVVRAIDNMSFEIGRGERVGLIGHNGAGKTTLPRTMAGIYEPTNGVLETAGHVMPLFNLMEGMMPDATGREFIRIRGVLLGLEPHQLDALAEDVIEFCELGSYIDMPVRTYSTGMLVRLAFALSTSVSPDILLFDELIGAGDARFVAKAQERLKSFIERSSVVVVASHSRAILEQWCNRLFLLEHGKLIADGSVHDVLEEYNQRLAAEARAGSPTSQSPAPRYLEPQGPLKPADAAVALIVDERGRYLMQLRDAKRTIFFPEHWGCFGGALEPGETDEECLAREIDEELGLDLRQCAVRHFTSFTFNFGFAGGSVIRRSFFEVKADSALLAKLPLREGQAKKLIAGPELLAMQVVPYDRFAIWMHCYRHELSQ